MNNQPILLVEDNPDDVILTRLAFRKAEVSHKLAVATDGREALDYLFSLDGDCGRDPDQKPRLVLLDLKLPFVSGLDVLKEIRANPDTSNLAVVVLTSSIEENDQRESYRLGANDYIRKPTSLSEFIEIVMQIKSKWLESD